MGSLPSTRRHLGLKPTWSWSSSSSSWPLLVEMACTNATSQATPHMKSRQIRMHHARPALGCIDSIGATSRQQVQSRTCACSAQIDIEFKKRATAERKKETFPLCETGYLGLLGSSASTRRSAIWSCRRSYLETTSTCQLVVTPGIRKGRIVHKEARKLQTSNMACRRRRDEATRWEFPSDE